MPSLKKQPFFSKQLFVLIFPWLLYVIAVTFYSYQYFLRVSITLLAPDLVGNLHISALNIGMIASSFLYTQLLMTIPSGMMLDHYGVRKMLSLAAAVCGVGCFIFAYSDQVVTLEIGRAFMGFGAAFAFTGLVALIRYWFSEHQYTFLISLTVMFGALAAAFSSGPLADFATQRGWESLMIGGGVLCFILAILFYKIVVHQHLPDHPPQRKKFYEILKQVLKSGNLWLIGTAYGFLMTVITAFIPLWAAPLIKSVYGHNYGEVAGYAISLFYIGMAIGCPIMAGISNYFDSRKRVLLFFTLLLLISILYIIYAEPPIWILMVLFVLSGFFYSCNFIYMTIVRNVTSIGLIATAISIVNILGYLIGSILAPIIGEMLGLATYHHGLPSLIDLPACEFRKVLTLIPLSILLSIIFLIFVKDLHVRKATEAQLEVFREET